MSSHVDVSSWTLQAQPSPMVQATVLSEEHVMPLFDLSDAFVGRSPNATLDMMEHHPETSFDAFQYPSYGPPPRPPPNRESPHSDASSFHPSSTDEVVEGSSFTAQQSSRVSMNVVNETGKSVAFDPSVTPDLNVAPANWLSRDDDHLLHLDAPWHPVTSSFDMIDAIGYTLNTESTLTADAYDNLQAPPVPSSDGGDRASGGKGKFTKPPDIVVPADQLKKLLLAPHTKSPLAFFAHRVGPSLILEGSSTSAQTTANVKDARRKSLHSKLLYYSVLGGEDGLDAFQKKMGKTPGAQKRTSSATTTPSKETPDQLGKVSGSSERLPQDNKNSTDAGSSFSEGPPPSAEPPFRRTLHWKFNDLNVLLGVNTPILRHKETGDELTLQMQDESHFFSKLDALDFWLDNIMTNVGSVAICYHRDGLVQGYQIVPTQDLPNLSTEKFEPVAIQRQASNVLNWLKTSCNREAGSYVVLKDSHSSELRLFDLTTMYEQDRKEKENMNQTAREEHLKVSAQKDSNMHMLPDRKKKRETVDWAEDSFDSGDKQVKDVVPVRNTSLVVHRIDEDEHDDDLEESRDSPPPGGFRAFGYPIAMMCFRMAQCLPNSDAETLRLLQKTIAVLDAGETAESAFTLASAHVQCMQHYHSSSPLSNSEEMSAHHGRLGITCLKSLLSLSVMEEFQKEAVDVQDKVIREAKSLSSTVVRVMCAMASDKVKKLQFIDGIEFMLVAQQALAIRRDEIPSGLLTENPISVESTDSVKNTQKPSADSRRRAEVVGAVIHLDMLVGDVETMLLKHIQTLTFLTPTETVEDGRVASSSTTSAGKKRIDTFFDKLNTSLALTLSISASKTHHYRSVVKNEEDEELPDRIDFINRLAPFVVDLERRMENGIASYRRAMSNANVLQSLRSVNDRGDGIMCELKKKMGGLYSQYADMIACGFNNDGTLCVPSSSSAKDTSLHIRAADFSKAATGYVHARAFFADAHDASNFLNSSTNCAKASVRAAELCSRENDLVGEVTQLKDAIVLLADTFASPLFSSASVDMRTAVAKIHTEVPLLLFSRIRGLASQQESLLHLIAFLEKFDISDHLNRSLAGLKKVDSLRTELFEEKLLTALVSWHLHIADLAKNGKNGGDRKRRVELEVFHRKAAIGRLRQLLQVQQIVRHDPNIATSSSNLTPNAIPLQSGSGSVRKGKGKRGQQQQQPKIGEMEATVEESMALHSHIDVVRKSLITTTTLVDCYSHLLQHVDYISDTRSASEVLKVSKDEVTLEIVETMITILCGCEMWLTFASENAQGILTLSDNGAPNSSFRWIAEYVAKVNSQLASSMIPLKKMMGSASNADVLHNHIRQCLSVEKVIPAVQGGNEVAVSPTVLTSQCSVALAAVKGLKNVFQGRVRKQTGKVA